MLLAAVLAVVLVGAVPALAQVMASLIDCTLGGECVGTEEEDVILGSGQQDVIQALGGDDIIDPGSDLEPDFVSCGPGFDSVNQSSTPLLNQQGALQYPSELDSIDSDCEATPSFSLSVEPTETEPPPSDTAPESGG